MRRVLALCLVILVVLVGIATWLNGDFRRGGPDTRVDAPRVAASTATATADLSRARVRVPPPDEPPPSVTPPPAPVAPVIATDRPLRVHVRRGDGAAVSAADVRVCSEVGVVILSGPSDDAGEFTGKISRSLRRFLIAVEHSEFGVNVEEFGPRNVASFGPSDSPIDVTVAMRPAGVLEGSVVANGAVAAPRDFQVIAWPTSAGYPTRAQVAAASQGLPGVHVTRTAGDGRFGIAGLETAATYLLIATAPGWAQYEGEIGGAGVRKVGGPPVTLHVAPVYVLDVRFVTPAGVEMSPSPSTSGWNLLPGAVGPLASHDAGLAVAIDSDSFPHEQTSRIFSVYLGQVDADRIGPFHGHFDVPGCLPVDRDVWAYRARDGKHRSQEIVVEPAVSGFGTLAVRWETEDVAAADVDDDVHPMPVSRACSIALRPDGWTLPGRSSLDLNFDSIGGVKTVHGVPAGDYKAWITTPLGVRRTTPIAVTIRPDETTDLVCPLPGCGSIEIDASISDAVGTRRYRGVASVQLQQDKQDGASAFWAFLSSPYRITGVAPGTYRLFFRAPGGRNEDSTPVTVAAGVRATAKLMVPNAQ